ncbi:MAG: 3-deoxy-7-phosphoheptulonate synthase [Chloroherpetonaceae bacterium]|nr:3-deoxy-7-phosphoheptulonate synthase [Chloroherpetonaceae bacterium]
MRIQLNNTRIVSYRNLLTPEQLIRAIPLCESSAARIAQHRRAIESILDAQDPRLFLVVGPCSIHDPVAALEYAHRLHALAQRVGETLILVMRVYFEKPRTVVGWKGFINDPRMNDTFAIEEGLQRARQLLVELADLGLPVATEALDPVMPQYLGDLITWTAIGARTTESQTHREMASGLSTPIGFKNGTDGSVEVAVNAILSSARPHHFLGINLQGQGAVFQTRGNPYGHIVLRGGREPNYDARSVAEVEARLESAGLPLNLVIDCSHGNSQKVYERQCLVFRDCLDQIERGNHSIVGLMLESHLFAGRQDIPADPAQLRYGVSVTDPCIDWATTESLILEAEARLCPLLAGRLQARRQHRRSVVRSRADQDLR